MPLSCYAGVMQLASSQRPRNAYELSAMSAEGRGKTAERKRRNDGVHRLPSDSRASTQGDAASTRRPSGATIRSITWRTASSPLNRRSATLSIRAPGSISGYWDGSELGELAAHEFHAIGAPCVHERLQDHRVLSGQLGVELVQRSAIRVTKTRPSSSGWRRPSIASRRNFVNSSRNGTP